MSTLLGFALAHAQNKFRRDEAEDELRSTEDRLASWRTNAQQWEHYALGLEAQVHQLLAQQETMSGELEHTKKEFYIMAAMAAGTAAVRNALLQEAQNSKATDLPISRSPELQSHIYDQAFIKKADADGFNGDAELHALKVKMGRL
jgi:hypothetical protein